MSGGELFGDILGGMGGSSFTFCCIWGEVIWLVGGQAGSGVGVGRFCTDVEGGSKLPPGVGSGMTTHSLAGVCGGIH